MMFVYFKISFYLNCKIQTSMLAYLFQHMVEKQELLRDSFILSGPHYENGKRIEGYRYYAKYVRNRKLWFSYTLFYPESCHSSLTRIFRQIDQWEV
jgi:hypothetical protein